MGFSKNESKLNKSEDSSTITTAKKRRIRRKKALAKHCSEKESSEIDNTLLKNNKKQELKNKTLANKNSDSDIGSNIPKKLLDDIAIEHKEANLVYDCGTMSSKEIPKSRDGVSASQARKQSKQKPNLINVDSSMKTKSPGNKSVTKKLETSPNVQRGPSLTKTVQSPKPSPKETDTIDNPELVDTQITKKTLREPDTPALTKTTKSNCEKAAEVAKSKDEVDKAVAAVDEIKLDAADKSRERIKAEREAKKLAKQAKKKDLPKEAADDVVVGKSDISKKLVVETLANIVEVVKEVQDVATKVNAITLDDSLKKENAPIVKQSKSNAELKAERRAKQEAQRAAKQGTVRNSSTDVKEKRDNVEKPSAKKVVIPPTNKDIKSSPVVKQTKAKTQHTAFRVDWFQHLYPKHYDGPLKKITLNSNLHPAIVKLGVQLSSRVVCGSNARCVALLNALKQVVSDYKVPDKTEFARGLEAHLTASMSYLWTFRQPNAAQINAVNFFRFQLTDLIKRNIEDDEHNSQAKQLLLEEIDKYVGEQIDTAGQAISITVRKKISSGDTILTYGCSSLIEKILCDAWEAGVPFRAVVAGSRDAPLGQEMLRRLAARRRPAAYVDIAALSFAMRTVDKVFLGASSVLMNGSVLAAAGTLHVALVARAHNVPLLVCCETHKFSERVLTDAFVYNEIGNPDNLIGDDDESPLKDWRSRPNLKLLNLTYDVTPPSLVTAVVTELAILPCTSAPVVHRIKLNNN